MVSMVQSAQGFVTYVGSRPTKFGKISHSFKVNTVDKFIGTAFVDPKLQKNDQISFDYEERNGYFNVVPGTISVIGGGETGPASAPAPSGKSEYQLKDEYWRAKEKRDLTNEGDRRATQLRIQHQSARNAAIEVVDILTRVGAIIIPEKKGAGAEVILGKINDLTAQFYEETALIGVPPASDQVADVAVSHDSADNWS